MKNPLKYLALWQKKRNELPVDLTPEQGWISMQSVLNKHLPVVPKGSGGSGGFGAAGIKSISLLIVSLSAAAVVYHFTYGTQAKQQHHKERSYHRKSHLINQDSLSGNAIVDSLKTTDQVSGKKDSLLKRTINTADPKDVTASGRSTGNAVNNVRNAGPDSANKTALLPATGASSKAAAVISGKTGKNLLPAFGNGINKPGKISKHIAGYKQGITYKSLTKIPLKINRLINANRSTGKYLPNLNNKNTIAKASGKGSLNIPVSNKDTAALAYKNDKRNKNTTIDSAASRNNKKSEAAKKSNIPQKQNKVKAAKIKSTSSSNFDFGILTGVDPSGSFTPKKQNANFYGSLPVDLYFGLFATYNVGSKLALDAQIRALTPQKISGSYKHVNGSNIDSGQTFKVADTRKAYFISIPVHAVYRVSDNLSIKAGPVINIPVKQITGSTTLLPANIKTDTPYYTTVTSQLKTTSYREKINFGLSGGVSVTYKRMFFEATYLRGLSGYNVTSGFGNYKATNGSLQFTIGFSLKNNKGSN